MHAARGTSAVLSLLAISLSACASASGVNGPGPNTQSAPYQRGYHVGQQARQRYGIRPGSTNQDLAAFCDETAYLDIQDMKGALILWSEGFDAGCRSSLEHRPIEYRPVEHSRIQPGVASTGVATTRDRVRRRPTGTHAPR